jgi:hypothetical protein
VAIMSAMYSRGNDNNKNGTVFDQYYSVDIIIILLFEDIIGKSFRKHAVTSVTMKNLTYKILYAAHTCQRRTGAQNPPSDKTEKGIHHDG